ncbi:3-carboxy-cis,cis-muconate cycloisomerase [Arboricoccus pini]|uniref:3-carboxy-cis,cis-muconate cycloisomerase n=1 Tax=Arboricoccus pini TaxID=1963835 RepID=A0A212R0M1_9PROT|nr:adenylosuccinate lyase family protein [Arboricoccus pini]SNB65549.1 3-carboxy-cis,cis-muconate cycloisomerase [Arboricoccus pini]
MASTVFDSLLFRDMFGTSGMREIFCDTALIGRYLEVEAALARAEAKLGVIPQEAGARIDLAAREITIDHERLRHETEIVGYPILPLVRQLAEAAGDSGGYVHWGATTQDIMDSAVVLQLRAALDMVDQDLGELATILAALAEKHRDTVMAGRTHLQHALPVTFGYKAAIWLSMIDRHRERLAQLRPRVLVGAFAGAAGTLASVAPRGLEIQAAFCQEMGLGQPVIAWHVARDSLAEAVAFLGLVTGSLAKIATDVMLMMTNEINEVQEPFVPGRGASSTMPQKRNPISSELILAAAKLVRQHVAAMLDAMVQDFERATGPWHVEWAVLPEAFILTAGALGNARFMLSGLVVDARRMRTNLDLTHGLIVAEAVMMAAAPRLGRQRAHDLVYEACRTALESDRDLAAVLAELPEIVEALGGREQVTVHCDPASYTGHSAEMVDLLLQRRPRR